MRIILLARKNQLMRFVNLRKKIIVLLVTAEVNYLATLYYQATKASSVEFCSAQTVPTSPGDKKVILQCLEIKIVATSYS